MKTCWHCSETFEGNFCPSCGEKWVEEKWCPQCGEKLKMGAKFCSGCGNAIANSANNQTQLTEKKASTTENLLSAFYRILKFIPALLFALFAGLLFAFFAAPVATSPLGELFEESGGSMGNVYSLSWGNLSEFVGLQKVGRVLLLCAAVTAVLSLIVLVIRCKPILGNKEINLFSQDVTVNALFAVLSFIFYIFFFIIGIIMCVFIVKFDEGMGLLKVGSCPKLLIAFSVVFFVLSTLAMIIRKELGNRTPELVTEEEKRLQSYLQLITTLRMSDNVKTIKPRAYAGRKDLVNVVIPNDVTSIGYNSFYGCRNLTKINIPPSVTNIGDCAFSGCNSLKSIEIPNSVMSIRYGTFSCCSSLTCVTIPDNVTSIGLWAFESCYRLTSVVIGNGVTSIGSYAFQSCRNLANIKFEGTKTEWRTIKKGIGWKRHVPATEVVCSDGTVTL